MDYYNFLFAATIQNYGVPCKYGHDLISEPVIYYAMWQKGHKVANYLIMLNCLDDPTVSQVPLNGSERRKLCQSGVMLAKLKGPFWF